MAISDVIQRGAVYYIYNNGKQTATIPTQVGELLGICNDFIILKQGRLYLTCGENGRKIGTVSIFVGDFKNATGNTFNLVKNGIIYSYNKKCRRVGTRSA